MASSEIIDLNGTNPAAPTNALNGTWQKGATTGNDPDSGVPIYPASVYIPGATTSSAGIVTPDGQTILNPSGNEISVALLSVQFIMNTGATGTNVGPMLLSPRQGKLTTCKVLTKASDSSTALTFSIYHNGTDIFSTNPTVAAGTASGTISTFTLPSSVSVAVNDTFSINVISGSANWEFTVVIQ